MTTVRSLGHSVFAFEHEGKTALVDPWLTGNPKAPIITDEVAADVIFLTHGHIDRIGIPSRSANAPARQS
jgi:L-ascorbate metabolism protein UlaG (beta-lactamase superfamily)